jgi:hypothetical protein
VIQALCFVEGVIQYDEELRATITVVGMFLLLLFQRHFHFLCIVLPERETALALLRNLQSPTRLEEVQERFADLWNSLLPSQG